MPHYEFRHVPDTPLTRVYVDGVYAQEFTSLYVARCWVVFMQTGKSVEYDNGLEYEDEEPPCDCYGCVTMRKPCVKD